MEMKSKLSLRFLLTLMTAVAFLFVGPAQIALAQTAMPCHTMTEVEETPPDKLPIPEKLSGIGNVHLKITATPEAQMWFDQGLNLLHDFWDYESARAFEQGVRVDPQCAMCYWGLYKAESFYHSRLTGKTCTDAVQLRRSSNGYRVCDALALIVFGQYFYHC